MELAACKVIPLSESRVNSPVVFNVPPFNVIKSETALPGSAPKLLSAVILTVPAEIPIFPVLVLDPDKVRIPLPCFIRFPAPDRTPEIVLLLLSPTVKSTELAISTLPVLSKL